MNDSIPPGAGRDKNAPWNLPEPTYKECPEFEGSGIILKQYENEFEKETCLDCNGTGEVQENDYE